MNPISQPFASYIVRDEAIRIALNKPVREDESHSALVAAGFQAILAALIASPAPAAQVPDVTSSQRPEPQLDVGSFQRDPRTRNAVRLSALAAETPAPPMEPESQLEPSCGLSGYDDERTTVQSVPSPQIISTTSSIPLTTNGPAVAPADTIAECIITMRHSGQTECRIRLDAPNLGLVDIRLIAHGAIVSARLTLADERSMRTMAEALPSVLARLEQAGVELGGMELAHRQTTGDEPADTPLGDTDFPRKDRGPAALAPLMIRGRLDVTV